MVQGISVQFHNEWEPIKEGDKIVAVEDGCDLRNGGKPYIYAKGWIGTAASSTDFQFGSIDIVFDNGITIGRCSTQKFRKIKEEKTMNKFSIGQVVVAIKDSTGGHYECGDTVQVIALHDDACKPLMTIKFEDGRTYEAARQDKFRLIDACEYNPFACLAPIMLGGPSLTPAPTDVIGCGTKVQIKQAPPNVDDGSCFIGKVGTVSSTKAYDGYGNGAFVKLDGKELWFPMTGLCAVAKVNPISFGVNAGSKVRIIGVPFFTTDSSVVGMTGTVLRGKGDPTHGYIAEVSIPGKTTWWYQPSAIESVDSGEQILIVDSRCDNLMFRGDRKAAAAYLADNKSLQPFAKAFITTEVSINKPSC